MDTSNVANRRPIEYKRKRIPRGKDPAPLQVSYFSLGVCGLNLEERGLVISLLDWHWDTGLMPPDDFRTLGAISLRSRFGGDYRQVNRIWGNEIVRIAFDRLRRQRQPVPDDKRMRVWNKTRGYCWHCSCELTQEPRKRNSFHVDHLKLVRHGGTSHVDNLVPSCRTCNLTRSKHISLDAGTPCHGSAST